MSSHLLTHSYTHPLMLPDDITLTAGRLVDQAVLGTKSLDFKTHRRSEGKVLSPRETGRWNSCPHPSHLHKPRTKNWYFKQKVNQEKNEKPQL